jgi:hypothetical protein
MGLFDKIFGSSAPAQTPAAPAPVDTAGKLNLLKERSEVVSSLRLRKGISYPSRVAAVLDYSGSMSSLYSSKEVQNIFDRLIPIALEFDSNKEIELFAFHDSPRDCGSVNIDNFQSAIKDKIQDKMSFGAYDYYAPTIRLLTKKYSSEKGDPVFVMFLLDGGCMDEVEAKKAIIEASEYGIFFQFIGIGRAKFKFLEELDTLAGRKIDNAGFFAIEDLSTMSDKALYSKLMSEYPDYITKAKQLNII